MISRLFAIYDSVPEMYNPPFPARTTEEGKFIFRNLVNDKRTRIHEHPEHYRLFEIGTYDDSTGVVVHGAAHVALGTGHEFVDHKIRSVAEDRGGDL